VFVCVVVCFLSGAPIIKCGGAAGGPSLQSPMICRLADGVSLTGEEGDKSSWRITMITLGR